MMTMKSALITGAASGIGKACAERMAQEGYGVVVADVNLPAAEELAAKLAAEGLSAIAVHMDVADEQEVEAGFDKMMETYGSCDLVMSNAGVQIVEGQLLHVDLYIMFRLKIGEGGLQGFGIGAAAKDQGHLRGFSGGVVCGRAAVISRGLGLAAAAGSQRKGHGQRQNQGQCFFHRVFLLILNVESVSLLLLDSTA